MKKFVQKPTQKSEQFAPSFLLQTPPPIASRPCSEAVVVAIRRC